MLRKRELRSPYAASRPIKVRGEDDSPRRPGGAATKETRHSSPSRGGARRTDRPTSVLTLGHAPVRGARTQSPCGGRS
jgi:hypothetical protein